MNINKRLKDFMRGNKPSELSDIKDAVEGLPPSIRPEAFNILMALAEMEDGTPDFTLLEDDAAWLWDGVDRGEWGRLRYTMALLHVCEIEGDKYVASSDGYQIRAIQITDDVPCGVYGLCPHDLNDPKGKRIYACQLVREFRSPQIEKCVPPKGHSPTMEWQGVQYPMMVTEEGRARVYFGKWASTAAEHKDGSKRRYSHVGEFRLKHLEEATSRMSNGRYAPPVTCQSEGANSPLRIDGWLARGGDCQVLFVAQPFYQSR